MPALQIDDQAVLRQELAAHIDRRIEDPAGVIPHVEDQLFDALGFEPLQRLLEFVGGLALELDDLHIADLVIEHLRLHALHLDRIADDLELLGLVPAFALDEKPDRRAFGPAHLVHGLVDGHVLGPFIVDLDDLVAGCKPGTVSRRALDRRDDRKQRVLDPDLDADALEFALDVHAHFLECPLGHVGRMRVKARQHAADGALDQFLGVGVFHIVALDQFQRLREEPSGPHTYLTWTGPPPGRSECRS